MSGLRQRLLTAGVVIPLAVAGVWFLPDPAFAALAAFFIFLAAWEWSKLMDRATLLARLAFVASLALLMGLTWGFHRNEMVILALMTLAALWWLGCFFWIGNYPYASPPGRRWGLVLRTLAGYFVLLPAFLSLAVLHGRGPDGPVWVLFLLALVWAADTGAYFVGRTLGKRNLLPRVSPRKTWEGVAGGLLLGLFIAAAIGAGVFGLRSGRLVGFLGLCLGVIAISVVGDLTISVMKRGAGIKDTGRLFPGHGGVLDRLDSLLAAGPCFMLGILGLGLH